MTTRRPVPPFFARTRCVRSFVVPHFVALSLVVVSLVVVSFVVVSLALSPSPALAEEAKRGPSTPEEREKALDYVEILETRPSSPEAKEARQWLVVWLAEVPDVTVKFCLEPLGAAEAREGIPAELVVQQAFSQAGFLLENPEGEGGSAEAYLAGVEGTLRAYEAMREAGTVDEHPGLEALLESEASGELEAFVRERAKTCG